MPKSKQGKNEEEVIAYLLLEATTEELMIAIGENDFFEGELVLVVKDEDSENYTVIEGNRRLTVAKLLNNLLLAKVKKSSVTEIANQAKYKPKSLRV